MKGLSYVAATGCLSASGPQQPCLKPVLEQLDGSICSFEGLEGGGWTSFVPCTLMKDVDLYAVPVQGAALEEVFRQQGVKAN